MSGTSLDGLDLVWVRFTPLPNQQWDLEWGPGRTVSYAGTRWEQDLPQAYIRSIESLKETSREYATWCNQQLLQFLKEEGLPQPEVVGHHGHTVHHRPNEGITYQLGNEPEMAAHLSGAVVGDFRVDDVALGGQGAPLVPVADRLLFSTYAHCVNLGGFANTSCEIDGLRRAWDVVPLNIIANELVQRVGLPFDDRGLLAASGTLLPALFSQLESLPYFQRMHPKSLAREDVERDWKPLLAKALAQHPLPNVLRTCTEHAASRVANDLRLGPPGTALLSGGGVHNEFFVRRLEHWSPRPLEVLDAHRSNFKEAAAFALLAALKVRGENNVLASVTGAERDHSAGRILKIHS
jgi:anhydro-N-acetylmuramic acid kinase